MTTFENLKMRVLHTLGSQKNMDDFVKMLDSQHKWCRANKDFYVGK